VPEKGYDRSKQGACQRASQHKPVEKGLKWGDWAGRQMVDNLQQVYASGDTNQAEGEGFSRRLFAWCFIHSFGY